MNRTQDDGERTGVPRILILVGLCLLAIAGLASIVGTLTSARARSPADSTRPGIQQAEAKYFSAVEDAETGQRGYLLTGDLSYLRPWLESERRLPTLEAELRRLTQDNSRQQQRLKQLDAAIGAKLRELDSSVFLRRGGQTAEALAIVRTNEGRDLMGQIRALMAEFDANERQAMRRREADARDITMALAVAVSLSVGLVALLAVAIFRAANVYEAALKDRNRALAEEMAERGKAEAQLHQAQKMESLGQLTGGAPPTTSTTCWR